jgi:hypothetical protein
VVSHLQPNVLQESARLNKRSQKQTYFFAPGPFYPWLPHVNVSINPELGVSLLTLPESSGPGMASISSTATALSSWLLALLMLSWKRGVGCTGVRVINLEIRGVDMVKGGQLAMDFTMLSLPTFIQPRL